MFIFIIIIIIIIIIDVAVVVVVAFFTISQNCRISLVVVVSLSVKSLQELLTNKTEQSLCGVVPNVLDWDVVVSVFEPPVVLFCSFSVLLP